MDLAGHDPERPAVEKEIRPAEPEAPRLPGQRGRQGEEGEGGEGPGDRSHADLPNERVAWRADSTIQLTFGTRPI
jgi:hypothetical protein